MELSNKKIKESKNGAGDGWPNLQRRWDDKGKSQHRIDKPRLQYVPPCAIQEISIKFNYNTMSRMEDNYRIRVKYCE